MLKLFLNENMKIYRRPRTWLLIGFMLVALLIHGISIHNVMSNVDPGVNENWKQQLVAENNDLQKDMQENQQLPDPIKANFKARIQKNNYAIEHDINPSEMTGWSYLKKTAELTVVVVICAVVIAGDIVSSEFSGGTIKMLLIRPVSRTKILITKYLASLTFAVVLTLGLAVLGYLLGGILFGFGGADQPLIYMNPNDNTIFTMSMAKSALLDYGLQMIPLVVVVTMAFMISAALRSTALAIAASLMSLFVGVNLVSFFRDYSWVKYILFADMNLQQYIEGPIMIEGMTLNFSLAMLAVYFVLFHLFAWLMFTKRDVAA